MWEHNNQKELWNMHLDITSIVQHRPKCTPVRVIYGPTVLLRSLGKICIVRAAMSLNIVDRGWIISHVVSMQCCVSCCLIREHFVASKAACITAVRNQGGLTQCFHPACKKLSLSVKIASAKCYKEGHERERSVDCTQSWWSVTYQKC